MDTGRVGDSCDLCKLWKLLEVIWFECISVFKFSKTPVIFKLERSKPRNLCAKITKLCKLETRLKCWTDDTFSWIETHPLVNCGKNQRKVCPSHSGLWLSATFGGGSTFMRGGELLCLRQPMSKGYTPDTPHRVHPPLFDQALSGPVVSTEFFLKASPKNQRTVPAGPKALLLYNSDFSQLCAQLAIYVWKIPRDSSIYQLTTQQWKAHLHHHSIAFTCIEEVSPLHLHLTLVSRPDLYLSVSFSETWPFCVIPVYNVD